MSRRCTVVLLLVLVAIALASAVAASATVPQAASRVRSAVLAIEAYRADRGTYVGVTLLKLRAYDRAVRSVTVKRTTKTAYCIQSTLPGAIVHLDGPKGAVRRGPCGVRGAVVPRPGAPSASTADPAAAKRQLQAAVFAIETYAGLTGSYTGLTLAKIRELDAAVQGIEVVWSTARAFCIESGAGSTCTAPGSPWRPAAAPRLRSARAERRRR